MFKSVLRNGSHDNRDWSYQNSVFSESLPDNFPTISSRLGASGCLRLLQGECNNPLSGLKIIGSSISISFHKGYQGSENQAGTTTIPQAWCDLILLSTLNRKLKRGKAKIHLLPTMSKCVNTKSYRISVPRKELPTFCINLRCKQVNIRTTKSFYDQLKCSLC